MRTEPQPRRLERTGILPAANLRNRSGRRRDKPVANNAVLKGRLEELVRTFDIKTITPDPLEVVRRYAVAEDCEVAGLVAAAFAYGRAEIVVRHAGWVLDRMSPTPSTYLLSGFNREEASHRFAGFVHRFHKTADLVALLQCLSGAMREHGSLGLLFSNGYDSSDADIRPSLQRFATKLLELGPSDDLRTTRNLRYLLTSPADGSACKRMNLFLRWMIRRTSPDLGLWAFADPAKLVIPLDTHVHRIAKFLGLGTRASADWKSARAITDQLAKFDPGDPVKYDFAICRLGILDLCSRQVRKEQCEVCQLNDVCRMRAR